MRDNFSNPNPFLSQVKNYQDLVNQPHWAEPLADSFKQLGNQPAKGPQQRGSNALMSGFASGIQGAVNKERQDRLSPILEQAGQITAKAAELEAQSQQERQRIFTGTKFVRENITRLSALGEASMARDEIGAQGVARELGREYQKSFGLTLGEFDHYDVNSRRIFYAKDGVVTGYSIPDTLREYATEAFGEQAPYVMRTLDPYSKNIWENTQAIQQAELAQKQSSAKMNNAHADLFKAETDKTRHEISPQAQEMEKNKKALDYRADHNAKHYIPEISNKFQKNNEIIEGANILKNVLNDTSLTGGSLGKKFLRVVASATGQDEKIIEAQNAGQFYLEWMNDNSTGALSDRDMKAYSKTFADPEKNRDACIAILDRLNTKLTKQNDIYKRQLNLYNEDPSANLHSLDLIQSKKSDNSGTVLMIAPDGSQREVPTDKVEFFKSKGAKVVNE